jgi:branched-chain amino acid transport system permease protein
MALLGQVLVAGLGTGAIYALIAYGIWMVYSVSKTLNFAHGQIVMTSVFICSVAVFLGAGTLFAIAIAIVSAVILGIALQKLVFKPLSSKPGSITWVLGAVVFAAILRDVATLIFESRSYTAPFSGIGAGVITMFGPEGIVFRSIYVWIIAAALLSSLGVDLLINRTAFGRSVRAVAESRQTAELMGIDSERVMTQTFALAAGIGALAGLLITPLTFISVSLGLLLTLKGFVAAVLGGLGRARGALVGGLLLGLIEQGLAAAEFMVPTSVGRYFSGGYRDAFAFLILIAVLVTRPTGLFGRPQASA